MQLKKTDVKKSLFAASCSVLTGHTMAGEWDFDVALMYYGESDRVQALEGIFSAQKTFESDKIFNVKLVVDSLSGASANGAVPQISPQTYTRPSGDGQYSASSGETPLDDTFQDTRVQIAAQWSQALGENYVTSTGINLSTEYDYRSIAFNGVLGRYFNSKNTTISLGLSYALDSIDAVGGRPIGLSEMVVDNGQFADEALFNSAFDATRQVDGEDGKDTLDIVWGLTQVINRRWITQFNLSLSEVDGYLTDPYKVVSDVDNSGVATRQLYENRPGSRSKQAFFAQSKYHFRNAVWDVSYRQTTDDWGINSHTFESRYRFLFNSNRYIEPHIRIYQQSEADFYSPFLRESEIIPEYTSADYRIGKLNAYTVGLKYGKKLRTGREYGVRLEYYNQTPQDLGLEVPGELNSLDLYPSLSAVILQFDYKF